MMSFGDFFQNILLAAVLVLSVQTAAAGEHKDAGHGGGHQAHFEPKTAPGPTQPTHHFSGSTAINRDHGLAFNSGVYGVPNEEIKKWGESPTWAVSLADQKYAFEQQERFVKTLDERIAFFEAAVVNWGRVNGPWPEAKEHAAKATADIGPRIDRARDTWSKAKSAGRGDWDKAQEDAKVAFIDLQSYYYSLHRNVR